MTEPTDNAWLAALEGSTGVAEHIVRAVAHARAEWEGSATADLRAQLAALPLCAQHRSARDICEACRREFQEDRVRELVELHVATLDEWARDRDELWAERDAAREEITRLTARVDGLMGCIVMEMEENILLFARLGVNAEIDAGRAGTDAINDAVGRLMEERDAARLRCREMEERMRFRGYHAPGRCDEAGHGADHIIGHRCLYDEPLLAPPLTAKGETE